MFQTVMFFSLSVAHIHFGTHQKKLLLCLLTN